MSKHDRQSDAGFHQGALSLALGGLALSAGAVQAATPVVTIVNAPITSSTTITYNALTQFTFSAPVPFSPVNTAAVSSAATGAKFPGSYITDVNGSALTAQNGDPFSVTGIGVIDQGVGTNVNSGSPFLAPNANPAKYGVGGSGNVYVGLETAAVAVASPSAAVTTNSVGLPVYGYAELNGANLIGYAFDPTPGQTIVTADLTPAVTAVPEPASLALLAVGAAGVLTLRHRKRAG